MKLDCVLTACNDNPLYKDFIPIFIKVWNILYPNVDVKIIFINETIPDELIQYKNNIILFNPLPNMSTAFISQYIRLLYPAILNYENGIMITDMDILPMNEVYYTKNIETTDNSKFVYLRNVLLDEGQIAMCYNVALNQTWKEIFDINSIDSIKQRLIDVYAKLNYNGNPGQCGWFTDQIDFYNYVMKWNKITNNFVSLNDNNTGYNRLDRIIFSLTNEIKDQIILHSFSDYHCLRPYKDHQISNDTIVELLCCKQNINL